MKEAEFSKKLRRALKASGFTVWPIETGSTSVGFPDLLAVGEGMAAFIEVKSRPSMTVRQVCRDSNLLGPGQKQFAREYNIGTCGVGTVGRFVAVAVYCKDGILFMRVKRDGTLEHSMSWGHDVGLKDRDRLAHAIYYTFNGGIEGGCVPYEQ